MDSNFEFKVLAQKLLDFKKSRKLTFQKIAKATGVDRSHIHRICNMKATPSLGFLIKLADYMEVPVFTLFIPTEEMLKQHSLENYQQMKIDIMKDCLTSLDLSQGQVEQVLELVENEILK